MKRLLRLPNRETLFNVEVCLRAAASARREPDAIRSDGRPTDLFLCLVDHYEPQLGGAPRELAQARVEDWMRRYPRIADGHRDADGRLPKHSFFYPWDEYDAWELDHIAQLCADGYGEVEIHLHHRDDTEASLRQKLQEAVRVFHTHGVLSGGPDGRPVFAFIHGNWALANSRSDNHRNYCGVNDEMRILQEEGCYADFTFPAWQHTAQPRQINQIYYATGGAGRPKGYDRGRQAQVGLKRPEGLLLVQGPLVPFVARRGRLWRIAMDDSDLAAYRRYSPDRLDRWVRTGVHVAGRPDRIFIKLHTHGADDRNRTTLLEKDLEALFTDAEARYNDGQRYRLHHVTAREMANIVWATEAGVDNLNAARDFVIPPPHPGHT